jgi:Lrp/AsnC family leucine-responsive transcriptional regulator
LVACVFVTPKPDSDESDLGEALAAIPDVQEVHYVAGEDCFMVKVRVGGTLQLERLRREKIIALPQVRSTRTVIALHTYKETLIPLDDSAIQKLKKGELNADVA